MVSKIELMTEKTIEIYTKVWFKDGFNDVGNVQVI